MSVRSSVVPVLAASGVAEREHEPLATELVVAMLPPTVTRSCCPESSAATGFSGSGGLKNRKLLKKKGGGVQKHAKAENMNRYTLLCATSGDKRLRQMMLANMEEAVVGRSFILHDFRVQGWCAQD